MLLKWLYISLGSLSIIGGLITFWLPLPIGIPLMMLGTPIIMRHSAKGRRWILRLSQHFPLLRRGLLRRPRQHKTGGDQ
ncbi:MAG: hypothetical protein P8045_02495 [Candidatus Thiodiazotropha sp.]|jgi:hypothetical protein